jgi:hypothetical protein
VAQRSGHGEGTESVYPVPDHDWSVANSSRLWLDCDCIVGVWILVDFGGCVFGLHTRIPLSGWWEICTGILFVGGA